MRNRILINTLKIGLLIVGAVLVGYLIGQPSPRSNEVEFKVPDLVLKEIGGDRFSLQSVAGRPYLLYVWDFG